MQHIILKLILISIKKEILLSYYLLIVMLNKFHLEHKHRTTNVYCFWSIKQQAYVENTN